MEVLETKGKRTSSGQGVFEANVEGCVGERCEGHAGLADHIFGPAVVIADCVFDLCGGVLAYCPVQFASYLSVQSAVDVLAALPVS